MKKRSSSIPLLVIVAVIALVLGSFGTATAAGLTKSQVKRIATKVVKKKAKTLSVAYAANAGNAANATNLNGLAASAYQDRVAQRATLNGNAATTGSIIVPATTITVPAGVNFLEVNSQATFFGNNTTTTLWFQVDAPSCSSFTEPGFSNRPFGDTNPVQDNIGYTMVVPVTPGVHSVILCGAAGVATSTDATLVLHTAATGSTGGTALRAGAPGGADDDITTGR
jgi:hypothetical protein